MDDYNDFLAARMASATMTRHTQPVQAQLSPGNYIFSDDFAQPSVTAAVNGDGSPSTQSSSFDMLTELSSVGGALQPAVNGAAATRVNGSTVPSSIFASAVASGGAADLLRPPAVRVGGSSNVPTSQMFGLDDSGRFGLASSSESTRYSLRFLRTPGYLPGSVRRSIQLHSPQSAGPFSTCSTFSLASPDMSLAPLLFRLHHNSPLAQSAPDTSSAPLYPDRHHTISILSVILLDLHFSFTPVNYALRSTLLHALVLNILHFPHNLLFNLNQLYSSFS